MTKRGMVSCRYRRPPQKNLACCHQVGRQSHATRPTQQSCQRSTRTACPRSLPRPFNVRPSQRATPQRMLPVY